MHLVVPPCAREGVAVLEVVLAVAVLAVVYPHACEARAVWIGLDAGAIALASSQDTDIALGGFAHVSVLEIFESARPMKRTCVLCFAKFVIEAHEL